MCNLSQYISWVIPPIQLLHSQYDQHTKQDLVQGQQGDLLYQEATQMLCFAVHPQLDQKDQRYQTATEGSMDSCLTQYQVQTEVDSATFYGKEWRGVLHLVQGWIQQAQPEKLIVTQPVALVLAMIFKELFPMEYEEHWQAFDAGVWLEDDPGSWLGCAIIYKLDGLIHIDTQQQKSHCIIPLWKVYQGGNDGSTVECQVQLLASYDPGHACIFCSAEIFHKVAKCNPEPHDPVNDTCTPGCIGSVFFFPQPSYDILKDKPRGWGAHTNYGQWNQFS
ncbi:hypothetical protein L208DRAFT_1379928 [Tricholoma matsutake]|nr:hypothetical protein L208DRAFT_1379928 [Tricholoma matsutake 945]